MKKLFVLTLILVMVLALTGCAKNYSTDLSVETTEFSFAPTEYTVPAGQEITITLINKGTVEHEFVIMKFGEAITIPFSDDDEGNIYWEVEAAPGETKTVTFTAPSDLGEYQVTCGTAGHAENGMFGKIFVVAP